MSILSPSIRVALRWFLVILLPSCVDSYTPDVISNTKSFLVINGYINSRGVSTITLQRTFAIDSKQTPPIERGAAVYIEEENGSRYVLPESATKGTYISASLTLNTQKSYRLRIVTSGGKEYASAYVPVKESPPIEEVKARPMEKGLGVYVNTRDATGKSKYYRWEYTETWEIIPPYRPRIEYKGFIRRIQVPYPTICWGSAQTADIRISRTTNLTQDVVSDFLVRTVPLNSERFYSRYSILVTQFALTQDEYDYWVLLKKNTEDIGTLFDPLPSQLTGNVRCLNDASELALGYVGVHATSDKRIFITPSNLPTDRRGLSGYESCIPPDTVELVDTDYAFNTGVLLPIEIVYTRGGNIRGHTSNVLDCIDCRTRGTAIKPDFWP